MTTSAKPTTCQHCHGKGYLRCACWPADCICGQDDEDCWVCDGTGEQWPDDDDHDDGMDF